MLGSSRHHLDSIYLLEIQAIDCWLIKEFLRSLHAADMREDERLNCASSKSSIKSLQVTSSSIARNFEKEA
jgi:uncharacterized membrane protein